MNSVNDKRTEIATLNLFSKKDPSLSIQVSVQVLNSSDLKTIENIQDRVVAEVGEERFSPVTMGMVSKSMDQQGGGSLGAFYEEKLIAVLVDFVDDEFLPIYIEKTGIAIDPKEGFRQYFYIVDPDFRGFSITQKLFAEAVKLETKRSTRHLLATVAVDNIASIKVLLNGGMKIHYVGPVYGEKVRFITYQNLQTPMNTFR